MSNNRRKFLGQLVATGALLGMSPALFSFSEKKKKPAEKARYTKGLVLSTWDHGIVANDAAMDVLKKGGNALDMAEMGVWKIESDLTGLSVGLGGLPDREGRTTLDACIMDWQHKVGSVAFVQGFEHPISIARAVLEKTPHAMIVGKGAEQFALEQGFKYNDYVNPEARKAWEEWLKTSQYKPIINIENHDTIGLLAMDYEGRISGSCTTSGLSYKLHGRVGDSPIIGAGLYIDNEVGGATCTGLGETVIRSCTSFLVVELMRQGATAQQACEEAIARLKSNNAFMVDEYQVGVLAVDKAGDIGGFGLRSGFTYALCKDGKNEMFTAGALIR